MLHFDRLRKVSCDAELAFLRRAVTTNGPISVIQLPEIAVCTTWALISFGSITALDSAAPADR
jgi:hypothetical protein